MAAYLLDFDWAGRLGVARYPFFLNRQLEWHANVIDGGLLAPEHDTWRLDLYQLDKDAWDYLPTSDDEDEEGEVDEVDEELEQPMAQLSVAGPGWQD